MIWTTARHRWAMAALLAAGVAASSAMAQTAQTPQPVQQAATPQGSQSSEDAPAAAPTGEQVITVHSTRDPVDKSYRKMIAGMDRFQRQHQLAPGAVLRFRLLPRLPGVSMDGITMKIVGDSIALPVPLAADNSFTLPRNAQALREDAALIASRKTSSMTWRADVRSPGVPAGMRRLGDLRLECLVGMEAGLVSNAQPLFAWLGNLLTDPDQVCAAADGNYLFFAERPLFNVTLQSGARRGTLPFRMLYAGGTQTAKTLPFCDCQVLLDRTYYAPLWDRSWPDDTLLGFESIDDPAAATQPQPPQSPSGSSP